jgi:exopolysaccharide biosynthesis WecB/TagA/CpsF family protein
MTELELDTQPTQVTFLGLPFATLNLTRTVNVVARASTDAVWRYIVTPNAAHLSRLRGSNPELTRIYQSAWLCLLDSKVIGLSARVLRLCPPPVIPGSDLVEALFDTAIGHATTICVVGGAEETVACLRKRFNVGVVSHVNPSMGFWRDPSEVERTAAFIIESQADFTFLSVGSPQAETLAARVAAMGSGRGVAICGGSAIDFIAGRQRRAPRLLRRMALEWAYRLYQEPRRLARRYAIESPLGLLLVLRHAFQWR